MLQRGGCTNIDSLREEDSVFEKLGEFPHNGEKKPPRRGA